MLSVKLLLRSAISATCRSLYLPVCAWLSVCLVIYVYIFQKKILNQNNSKFEHIEPSQSRCSN